MPQTPSFLYGKGPGGPAPVPVDANGAFLVSQANTTNVVGANAGLAVKAGAGTLRGISVNTAGTGSTLVIYDGTSTAGTKLGTFSTLAQVSMDSLFWKFSTGLFVVTTGTVADVTIAYN